MTPTTKVTEKPKPSDIGYGAVGLVTVGAVAYTVGKIIRLALAFHNRPKLLSPPTPPLGKVSAPPAATTPPAVTLPPAVTTPSVANIPPATSPLENREETASHQSDSPSLDPLLNTPPAEIIAAPPQQEKLQHFTDVIGWGKHSYLIEQDLPDSTSPEDWKAIVNAYQNILDTEICNEKEVLEGIPTLQLFLDAEKRTLRVSIPSRSDRPEFEITQNEAVEALIGYHEAPKETKKSHLFCYRKEDFLPDTVRSKPPIGLKNPPSRFCWANSLIQMIMAYPRLLSEIETIENDVIKKIIQQYKTDQLNGVSPCTANTGTLEPVLFRGEATKQYRDPQDALISLINQYLPEETLFHANLTRYTFGTPKDQPDATPEVIATKSTSRIPEISFYPHQNSVQQAITESLIERLEESNLSMDVKGKQYKILGKKTIWEKAPETLTITRSIVSKEPLQQKVSIPKACILNPREEVIYQLRSFCEYLPNSRHYISYVKIKGESGATEYYMMNDTTKTKITEEEFLISSQRFRLAFYDKISKTEELREAPTSTSSTENAIPPTFVSRVEEID